MSYLTQEKDEDNRASLKDAVVSRGFANLLWDVPAKGSVERTQISREGSYNVHSFSMAALDP